MIDYNIQIEGGGYKALIDSKRGATCFRLINQHLGVDIYRTPQSDAEWKENPFLFGNPALFPPNRIRNGEFVFEGRKYGFPINECSTNCHLHGALYSVPFEIKSIDSRSATFSYSARKDEYLGFPHDFSFTRKYSLDENGLTEMDEITNLSDENMPFYFALHNTYNIPFLREGKRENVYLRIPVTREHKRDGKLLPVNEFCFFERERKMRDGKFSFDEGDDSAFFQTDGEVVIRLGDFEKGVRVCCKCSPEFGYVMFYRPGNAFYAAIEPQTAEIDCFNSTSPENSGGMVIAPGRTVRLKTLTYAEKFI